MPPARSPLLMNHGLRGDPILLRPDSPLFSGPLLGQLGSSSRRPPSKDRKALSGFGSNPRSDRQGPGRRGPAHRHPSSPHIYPLKGHREGGVSRHPHLQAHRVQHGLGCHAHQLGRSSRGALPRPGSKSGPRGSGCLGTLVAGGRRGRGESGHASPNYHPRGSGPPPYGGTPSSLGPGGRGSLQGGPAGSCMPWLGGGLMA